MHTGAVSDPRISLCRCMYICIHTCVVQKCVASAGAVSDPRISLCRGMCICIHTCVMHRCVTSAGAVSDPQIPGLAYIELCVQRKSCPRAAPAGSKPKLRCERVCPRAREKNPRGRNPGQEPPKPRFIKDK